MMSEEMHTGNPDPGLIGNFTNRLRLAWRLMGDRRVPLWVKALPVLTVLYVLSPVDFIPELLLPALGPLVALDDLGIILLGLNLFINLAPEHIVAQYSRDLSGDAGGVQSAEGASSAEEGAPPMVEGFYSVVDGDEG